jgi:hypothetical protein
VTNSKTPYLKPKALNSQGCTELYLDQITRKRWLRFLLAEMLDVGEHQVDVADPGPPVLVVVDGYSLDDDGEPDAQVYLAHPHLEGIPVEWVCEKLWRGTPLLLPVSAIQVGSRFRKDLGDLEEITKAMQNGLAPSIGVSPGLQLVFGERRLAAAKLLGWQRIRTTVIDVDSLALGQIKENEARKAYTPSERVAIVDMLRTYKHGGNRKTTQGRKCDVEAAASRVGWKKDTYFRAKKVVEAGTTELMEAMDAGQVAISAAAILAEVTPEEQRAVLERQQNDDTVLRRGIRKTLTRVRRQEERRIRAALPVGTVADSDIQIFHRDFRDLEVEDRSVPLIFTDPLYHEIHLPLWEDLAAFAARKLRPGGFLVAYSGIAFLPKVLAALERHLTFHWQRIILFGEGVLLREMRVINSYKPVLCFSNGEAESPVFPDVLRSTGREKTLHEYQQGTEQAMYLIEQFTRPGDLVLDPFAGHTAWTAISCFRLGRRYLSCDIDAEAVRASLICLETERRKPRQVEDSEGTPA